MICNQCGSPLIRDDNEWYYSCGSCNYITYYKNGLVEYFRFQSAYNGLYFYYNQDAGENCRINSMKLNYKIVPNIINDVIYIKEFVNRIKNLVIIL